MPFRPNAGWLPFETVKDDLHAIVPHAPSVVEVGRIALLSFLSTTTATKKHTQFNRTTRVNPQLWPVAREVYPTLRRVAEHLTANRGWHY